MSADPKLPRTLAEAREADAERKEAAVTPEEMRRSAAHFEARGAHGTAEILRAEAAAIENRRTRVSLCDYVAQAFTDAYFEAHPDVLNKYGWDDFPEDAERDPWRAGTRAALKALAKLDSNQQAERAMVVRDAAVQEVLEALRLTVEYVGVQTLPPLAGWSWYDAMKKYAPVTAERFVEEWEKAKDLPRSSVTVEDLAERANYGRNRALNAVAQIVENVAEWDVPLSTRYGIAERAVDAIVAILTERPAFFTEREAPRTEASTLRDQGKQGLLQHLPASDHKKEF